MAMGLVVPLNSRTITSGSQAVKEHGVGHFNLVHKADLILSSRSISYEVNPSLCPKASLNPPAHAHETEIASDGSYQLVPFRLSKTTQYANNVLRYALLRDSFNL